jgi:hypothetical protein
MATKKPGYQKTAAVDDQDAIERILDELENTNDAAEADENAAEDKAEGEGNDLYEPMSDDNLEAIVAGELQDCVRYIDFEIGNARALATSYYRGDPLGDEEEGRSRVISMDVRDTVISLMPQLMRIFFSSEKIVEYTPETPGEVEMAQQATDYADYIVQRDNEGFKVIYSAIKDALVRKSGFVKYWWNDNEEVHTENYTGLEDSSVAMLMQDNEGVDFQIEASYPMPGAQPTPMIDPQTGQPMMGPDGQPMMQPVPLAHDVRIKRRISKGRISIQSMPPEEFLIDRRARSVKDAMVVAHRSMKTISELVSMGYDEEDMKEFVTSNELDTNIEYITRQPLARAVGGFDSFNPALGRVLYIEAYAKVDFDGDGIAELRKVCMAGPTFSLLHHEPVDHMPFAIFECDPEPHAFFGLSIADVTMDIQRIKSHLMRGMLDSLAQSINPRMSIVEGQVNMDDVLNNEVGAIIRQRAPGMTQQLETSFVGGAAMPVLDYMDTVKEARTGMSKASMGLDADALQSSTKAAVNATITAGQGQVELLARVLAEGMKQLFKGILFLIVQNQDKGRMIKLRDKWVEMDPRTWNANMDVSVNVALGTGTAETKMAMLAQVAAKQEQILQQLGPSNPVVSVGQYVNTLRQMTELSGFKDSSKYFNELPLDFKIDIPQKPTPEEVLAEAQAQAVQADVAKKAAELEIKERNDLMVDARERERISGDQVLKKYELELKYSTDISDQAMQRDIAIGTEQTRRSAAVEQAMVSQMPAPQQPQQPQQPQPPQGLV